MKSLVDLPLFPLGLVCFPGDKLPLHIFEPRYLAMIGRCRRNDAPFGILLVEDEKLARVGCLVRIEEVGPENPDGSCDIVVRGEARFAVRSVRTERDVLTGDGETLGEGAGPADPGLRARLIAQHMRLLELAGRPLRPALYETARDLSYLLAHNTGLSLSQKQALLELPSLGERLAFLSRHLEGFIPRVEQAEELRRKIGSNGHFPDFPPPAA